VGLLRLGGKTYYCVDVWNSAIATDAAIFRRVCKIAISDC